MAQHTAQTPATALGRVRSTKKYKALIALGMDDERALVQLGHVAAAPVDPRLANLVAGGFSEEEAAQVLASLDAEKGAPAPVLALVPAPAPEPVKPPTAAEVADALVAGRGFVHTTGRVYSNAAIIEAQARVLKTGTPEVVASSGTGRTKAVVIFRMDNGDVAVQNLKAPKDAA